MRETVNRRPKRPYSVCKQGPLDDDLCLFTTHLKYIERLSIIIPLLTNDL